MAILIALLIISFGFGAWAYIGKADLQTNTNKKIDSAVAAAKTAQAAALQAQFEAANKSPNKTFSGSATYGSITFDYPKTWSAYVDTTNSSEPINAYFHPDSVPGIQGSTNYALRVEVVAGTYSDILAGYQSQITAGKLTAAAYIPPKLAGVANVQAGTKLDGLLNDNAKVSGSMVVMKVRDKTLKVYTMSNDYVADFNNTVLPSLTFAP